MKLFEFAKEYYQWIIDSKQMRTDLEKIISDMEDLSSRVLNPGSHAGIALFIKRK